MSRSGYDAEGDDDNPIMYLWESIVARSIAGARGQKLLRELADALDAILEKRLVSGSFVETDGAVCTLGALGRARGLDMTELEKAARLARDDDWYDVAGPAGKAFGVSRSMAAEIMHQNDQDAGWQRTPTETPEQRWTRMREWVRTKLKEESL